MTCSASCKTLNAMNELAVSYEIVGRWDEALKLKEQVLILRRKVFGPEHPDTLHAMNTTTELNARCDKIST